MTTSTVQPAPIVVGLDGSAASISAVDWALNAAEESGRPLLLVHAVHEYWMDPKVSHYAAVIAAARNLLHDAVEHARLAAPTVQVGTRVHSGDAARILVDLSRDAHLIVVGTDRNNPESGELSGTLSQQIAIMSEAPVAVVPVTTGTPKPLVVVGADGSQESMEALSYAADTAARRNLGLTILHSCAVPSPWMASGANDAVADQRRIKTGQALLDSTLQNVKARYPSLALQGVLETTVAPAEALLSAARNAQLLVVGSLGSGAVKRMMLGAVSHKILLNLGCPLVITRPAPGAG